MNISALTVNVKSGECVGQAAHSQADIKSVSVWVYGCKHTRSNEKMKSKTKTNKDKAVCKVYKQIMNDNSGIWYYIR